MRADIVAAGRTPTTSITASVIAALQCQEAVKLLHRLPALSGEGLVFDGMWNELYRVAFSRHEDCNSHDTLTDVVPLPMSIYTTTARELLDRARTQLGAGAQLELRHEVLAALECGRCASVERVMEPLESVSERRAACPSCGDMRRPSTFRTIDGSSAYLDAALAELGVPPFDIVVARNGEGSCGYELAADAPAVLGAAAAPMAPAAL